jgi:1-acyl-sn-glycerol-3-phosphate acyltransferase
MPKQTNKIYSTWLTCKLSLICLYYPLKINILSYFKKISRKDADKIIENFATNLLKSLKIKFIYNNWQFLNSLPKNKPIILMSNHASLYDIPIILYNVPKNISLRMLAKKELNNIPIFGRGMRNLEFPIIDRKNRKQAIIDLEYTKNLMQNGLVIWAAPEGTRSKDGQLLPFKKGIFIMAIEIGALIVPISIKGANKVLPAHSYNYSIGETITLSVGDAVDTAQFTMEDKDLIIEKIRKEIAKNI